MKRSPGDKPITEGDVMTTIANPITRVSVPTRASFLMLSGSMPSRS
jgi:hypothetical protein